MWIEKIKLIDLLTFEKFDLQCSGDFRNHTNTTKMSTTQNYNSVSVNYANYSTEDITFIPLDFKFKAYTKKENMSNFKEKLRGENKKMGLEFVYNNDTFYVVVVVKGEDLEDAFQNGIRERHEINFTTEHHFLKIKDYPFKFEDTGVGNTGDQLPVQLPFKLDRSRKNSTEEAIVYFDVEGDLKSFLRVEMYGPESGVIPYSNPKFGLNKLASNTINSFDCKNTPLHVGDLLVVDSFPLRREIKKNGVDFESNALFLEHRCFFGVDPKTKDNRLVFQNCLHGNIKVYNQYRLPR